MGETAAQFATESIVVEQETIDFQLWEAELQEANQEEYAHSQRTIRRLGRLMIEDCSLAELQSIEQLTWANFHSGIAEMIKTDSEFRAMLDIATPLEYKIIDGKACAADGTPMVTITETGRERSRLAAESDEDMQAQFIRDSGDVENAKAVDELAPGMSRIVLSMEPKKQLRKNKKKWEAKGYREGIAYLQWYAKTADAVFAGPLSVDFSDKTAWRELFSEMGIEVPEDESPNTWIRHALKLSGSPEETYQAALNIRARYYQKVGARQQRKSIDEYLVQQEKILQQYFQAYYPILAVAAYTKHNHTLLQDFAQKLYSLDSVDATVKDRLGCIAYSYDFDTQSSATMDDVIRYAVVEELRKGLRGYIDGVATSSVNFIPAQAPRLYGAVIGWQTNMIPPEILNQMATENVRTGTEAGRAYGGCTNVDIADSQRRAETSRENNQQDVYGGNLPQASNNESANGECSYTHDGCYCSPYESDGSLSRKKITVLAKRGKDGVARCQRTGCGAWLGGSDKFEGYIWQKAQKRLKQAEATMVERVNEVYAEAGVESLEAELDEGN